MTFELRPDTLDRMVRAVERVRERLVRAGLALKRAGIPFAIAGGNAVAAWVAQLDEGAVRNTRDVDILLRRKDMEAAKRAMAAAGFVYRHAAGLDMFLESPDAKARDGIHIVFAGEKATPTSLEACPDVTCSTALRPFGLDETFPIVDLEKLVRMKLTAYRDKDRTHLRDMLEVGLIEAAWVQRLPAELAYRLQYLIDTPGG
ncbi:MAG: hypothetical protein HY319_07525 [Armatimonadetes bacterium]|nr:hypothetical protein [Armatimonadota bacterium]